MKFRLLSDLHLEFRTKEVSSIVSNVKKFNESDKADYLILAGDITNNKHLDSLVKFIKALHEDYIKIFYILGNHELYFTNSDNTVEMYRNLVKDFVVFLENETYDLGKISIAGTTLWSNVSLNDYYMLNDKNFISHDKILETHNKSKEFIKNLPTDKKYIIITHHMPHKSLIDKKYRKYSSTGFASNLDELFKEHILYWCYGHTHTPNRSVINGINFLCNPLGYPGENSFEDCVFEIN
jgi:predicted phosphodiesterase